MANINLLPWREEQRRQRNHDFLMTLGVVAATGVALIVLADTAVNNAIDYQSARNNYLKKQLAELELHIKDIRELESKKQALLNRMDVIQQLQGNRSVVVRMFDEITKTLPEGVFYTRLSRTNDVIKLTGIAQSTNRISTLMRMIDKSGWFDSPNLTAVTTQPDFAEQASEFSLSFRLSTSSAVEQGEE